MFFKEHTVRRPGMIAVVILLVGIMLLPLPFNNTALAGEDESGSGEELRELLLDLNRDLQEMERRLTLEVVTAVRTHRDLVRAIQPYMEDRFTVSWNGIVLQEQKPVWTGPENWNGYWDLKTASELSSSDPAADIYWPLVEEPGLVEMITMDLKYLEGTAYAAATGTLYTDTLISVSLDWFTALYSDDYTALLPLVERVAGSYVMQHNLSALLKGEGSLIEVEITPPGEGRPLSSGAVNFSSRPLVTYSGLLGILDDIIGPGGDLSLSAMVDAVAAAVDDEAALASREQEDESSTTVVVPGEEATVSPGAKTGKSLLAIYLIWPFSILAAAAGAYLLGRRLRVLDQGNR